MLMFLSDMRRPPVFNAACINELKSGPAAQGRESTGAVVSPRDWAVPGRASAWSGNVVVIALFPGGQRE
jgi:hypothetical protein